MKALPATLLLSLLPFLAAAPIVPPATQPHLPHLYIVGDSLVKTRAPNREGWGDELAQFFDSAKITVENVAQTGQSSRTYYLLDDWPPVKQKLQKGDFVLIEFSIIDTKSAMNLTRYTLPGNGTDTEEVVDTRTGEKLPVHSYGWYLRQYINDARAAGATPIIVAPLGRVRWNGDTVQRDDFAKWSEEAAKEAKAPLIDLSKVAAERLQKLGQEKSRPYFLADNTTKPGAVFMAACITEAIAADAASPLKPYLLPTAKDAAAKLTAPQ